MEKFTVIIPTLNRCDTLADTLETCVGQKDEAFQIVVSDNHSTDATREIISDFQKRDARVSYVRPDKRLGMAAHFEFALSHVSEGFAMLLGSDDGLFPDSMTRARECLAMHPQAGAVAGGFNPYLYPTAKHPRAGLLCVTTRREVTVRQARPWLKKVAQNVGFPHELPYPYVGGFTRVSLYEELRRKTGRLIQSCMPDVYLCYATSALMTDYVYSSQPLAICGISGDSTGTSGVRPGGDAKIRNSFFQESDPPWHPEMPFIPSQHVVHAEPFLRARDAGILPEDVELNWPRIIARGYQALRQLEWSPEEAQAFLADLRALSRQRGCESVLPAGSETPDLEAWEKGLPVTLDWEGGTHDMELDTIEYGVRGVHEAARLAYFLMKSANTPADSRTDGAIFSDAFANIFLRPSGQQVSDAGLAALASALVHWRRDEKPLRDDLQAMRGRLEKVEGDSARRAAERDRAKDSLARTRQKLDAARAKGGSSFRSWLSKRGK